jgi:hypothetical protein
MIAVAAVASAIGLNPAVRFPHCLVSSTPVSLTSDEKKIRAALVEHARIAIDSIVAMSNQTQSSGVGSARKLDWPTMSRLTNSAHHYLGISTVSMTWITPLSATMSVLTTCALFTMTPPMVVTVKSEP